MKSITNIVIALCLLSQFTSCKSEPKTEVDLIIIAQKIYTSNESFETCEALAINQGNIVALGSREEIETKYVSETVQEYPGFVYPGFIDAHSHFYGYGSKLSQIDLIGTTSLSDVIQKTIEFGSKTNDYWIMGRGWDENDWVTKGFINNLELSLRFPDRPVVLKRVDGHSALVNNYALDLAGITANTKVDGGEVIVRGGQMSGLLVDNAVDLVTDIIDKPSRANQIKALLSAQANCLKAGLTCISDAGLSLEIINLIDSLQKTGDLKIRVYAMADPSKENFAHFLKTGPISNGRLQMSSFKIYADGSLGSHGAKLKKSYCDMDDYTGLWLTKPERIDSICKVLYDAGFQVNSHCIGDSANRKVLEIYGSYLGGKNDRRWRIEHAQVVSPEDRILFADFDVIPSVQPTHATSDMYWADNQLCMDRMDGAYAYKSLLETCGILALGTDFPVEDINPLHTFYSAVYRMDEKNRPIGGFQMKDALSPKNTLLGMTRWAAYANFMDKNIGSIEPGKKADLVVLDIDLMIEKYVRNGQVIATYIDGVNLR